MHNATDYNIVDNGSAHAMVNSKSSSGVHTMNNAQSSSRGQSSSGGGQSSSGVGQPINTFADNYNSPIPYGLLGIMSDNQLKSCLEEINDYHKLRGTRTLELNLIILHFSKKKNMLNMAKDLNFLIKY